MSGAACAKQIIDQGAGRSAAVSNIQTSVDRALKCLTATSYIAPNHTVDEAMVEKMLEAGTRFETAIKTAADGYLMILSQLEEEARANWPQEEKEKQKKPSEEGL